MYARTTAVLHAQQERSSREHERQRHPAAVCIQRVWRGQKARRKLRDEWTREWNDCEREWSIPSPLSSNDQENEQVEDVIKQVRLLVRFNSPVTQQGMDRIQQVARRLSQKSHKFNIAVGRDERIRFPAFKLVQNIGKAFGTFPPESLSHDVSCDLVRLLIILVAWSCELLGRYAPLYFRTVVLASQSCHDTPLLRRAVVALLEKQPPEDRQCVYRGMIFELLTCPSIPGFNQDPGAVGEMVDMESFTAELNSLISVDSTPDGLSSRSTEALLCVLANYISLSDRNRQKATQSSVLTFHSISLENETIAMLLARVAKEFSRLIEVDENDSTKDQSFLFIKSQIGSLVSPTGLNRLFSQAQYSSQSEHDVSRNNLATSKLALTLISTFPRHGDDIRLALFRSSLAVNSSTPSQVPATKSLMQIIVTTHIFKDVSRHPMHAIEPLKSPKSLAPAVQTQLRQEWTFIVLFLELYAFILKVMDDDEFFRGTDESQPAESWTVQSALSLEHVRRLIEFLKNLTFCLYYHAAEIADIQPREMNQSLASYFRIDQHHGLPQDTSIQSDIPTHEVGGIVDMTLDSLKGLSTGILRMLYERDSRRNFLPRDFWLMTRYFEMDKFINAVVEEDEHKHQMRDHMAIDTLKEDEVDDDASENDESMIGAERTRQIRNVDRLKRQQQVASRKRHLKSITPRLEILENLPFFIPFNTRVQIFRQFVTLDQMRRRGTLNPDEWRFNMSHFLRGDPRQHQATVRRNHVFDDAYHAFYDLGDALKEPFQITFKDKFDITEMGIDGGGVTKEFLTTITNEAFGGAHDYDAMFAENDQHLLFPNPQFLQERMESLRAALFQEGSADWNQNLRDLLQRYEFLGRIIGKCLYEGILIDVQFAPFFLIKWALTGGQNSGGKETSYRANINDLRDLDQGLYDGLLKLKNYNGDIEEDFGLNFTVTDTIPLGPKQTKTVTTSLRPGGESLAVTNENRLVYIAAVASYRLQRQPFKQTSAFLRGLSAIISPSWLAMFNQSELQTLLGGSGSALSIADLRAHTEYGGLYALGDDKLEHPTIVLFWKVLERLDTSDVAKLLKFVTSTPRGPLLGFAHLEPKFSIRDNGSDQSRLPTTSTCVNLLKLPVYQDEDTLKERLLYSINAGAGFDLS